MKFREDSALTRPPVMREKSKRKRGDVAFLIAVALLAAIGLIFIYSASSYSAQKTYGDAFYFVKKQAIGLALGGAAMIFACFFDYEKLKKISLPLAAVSVVLLSLVFVPKIGVENYGAKRWIGLGAFTLQPSEIAKLSLIILAASYFSAKPDRAKSFIGILPVLLYGLILCGLIIAEPNMSITVCVALLLFTMLFAAGMKIKHCVFLIIPAIIAGVALMIFEPYRLKRFTAFLNPWSDPKGEGYQLLQSLYALGSGGWFGVGLFSSRQKYAFLPFAESDFIISVIGEETGFIGLAVFIFIAAFIVLRGVRAAARAKDEFGFMLALGITMIFGIQTLVNVLVVTGSIPPTGLSMPLVSSGNTSIIIFMAEAGIVYNVSRQGSLTF